MENKEISLDIMQQELQIGVDDSMKTKMAYCKIDQTPRKVVISHRHTSDIWKTATATTRHLCSDQSRLLTLPEQPFCLPTLPRDRSSWGKVKLTAEQEKEGEVEIQEDRAAAPLSQHRSRGHGLVGAAATAVAAAADSAQRLSVKEETIFLRDGPTRVTDPTELPTEILGAPETANTDLEDS
ncbi:hypothetical protein QTO34_004116 [Cnephaeus nilssonii]|uniref:Uncharacterized protein n=1 Tax=Cnephaeus nilssonii TaxID=3371016 RepID=A0AA40HRX0_CNENI|nr:hypothetical protein QTO34_004116 [Eptesicus nilssonii]